MKLSPLMTAVGILIAIASAVALVWIELDFPGGGGEVFGGAYRMYLAVGPITGIGVGLLVVIGAQILNRYEAGSRDHTSI